MLYNILTDIFPYAIRTGLFDGTYKEGKMRIFTCVTLFLDRFCIRRAVLKYVNTLAIEKLRPLSTVTVNDNHYNKIPASFHWFLIHLPSLFLLCKAQWLPLTSPPKRKHKVWCILQQVVENYDKKNSIVIIIHFN